MGAFCVIVGGSWGRYVLRVCTTGRTIGGSIRLLVVSGPALPLQFDPMFLCIN